ncbi:uncharacterized protein EDB93DRAFT_1076831 [Suillus bovinus]|uniref:uncharacterized protein n=1 Tax=Suillus bovinus TaxID=48563 RepID=UPI001B86CC89|nr:uncharacterized protein EDB93DRAFT_1076831 [Suillus bovinus]KAG2158518.1 hypothetical protein EDB93DRAFT_1076831 [Suillus bovinus]
MSLWHFRHLFDYFWISILALCIAPFFFNPHQFASAEFVSGLGTHVMSQLAHEFIVKIIELLLWSSDLLIGHYCSY